MAAYRSPFERGHMGFEVGELVFEVTVTAEFCSDASIVASTSVMLCMWEICLDCMEQVVCAPLWMCKFIDVHQPAVS